MKAYCSHCDQLVPVHAGEINPRGDGRARIVRPLPHLDALGRQCVGIHEDAGRSYFPECDVKPAVEVPRVELDLENEATREIAAESKDRLR